MRYRTIGRLALAAGASLLASARAGAQSDTPRVPVDPAIQAAIDAGRYDAAITALAPVGESCIARHGGAGAAAAPCLDVLAAWIDMLLSEGRAPQAERVARQRLAIAAARFGDTHGETGAALSDLAIAIEKRGDRGEAERLLRRELAITLATSGRDSVDVVISYSNLAGVLDRQGRYREALAHRHEALAIARAALGETHEQTIGSVARLGFTLQNNGDYAAAETAYRSALTGLQRTLPPGHPLIGNTLSNLATNLQTVGRFAEARALLEAAVDGYAASGGRNSAKMVYALGALGRNSLMEGRPALALDQYDRALAIAAALEGAAGQMRSSPLSGIARAHVALGDPARALPLFRQSLAIEQAQSRPDPTRVAAASLFVAETELALGRPAAAVRLARQALATRDDGARRGADARVVLGRALLAAGQPAAALEQADRAVAMVDAAGLRDSPQRIEALATVAAARLALPHARGTARLAIETAMAQVAARAAATGWFDIAAQRYLTRQTRLFDLAIRERWQAGGAHTACDADCAAAFLSAQRGVNLAAAAALVHSRDLSPELRALGTERDGLQAEREAIDRRMVDPALDAAALAELTRRRAAIDSRRAAIETVGTPLAPPVPLSIDAVRGRLRPGQGLLLLAPADEATQLWIVTRDTARWHRAALPAGRLEALLARAGSGQGRAMRGQLRSGGGPDAATLTWLGRHLLPDGLPTGIDTLFVVSGGASAAVPIAALPLGGGVVNDRIALVAVPGVSQLNLPLARDAAATGGFYGIGAVDPAVLSDGERLPPLRFAAEELAAAAALFPDATLRTGDAAREAALSRDAALSSAQRVLFSTHGLIRVVDGESQPGLVLAGGGGSDGFLTPAEVARLSLRADLVVLAACDGMAPDATLGADPFSGLARAFLHAGAGAVLVSQRPVDDEATRYLIHALFRELSGDPGLSLAQALRRAMASTRTAGGGRWRDPRYWASFVLVSPDDGAPSPGTAAVVPPIASPASDPPDDQPVRLAAFAALSAARTVAVATSPSMPTPNTRRPSDRLHSR